MARIRTVKPEFFLNEELAEIPMAGRLLFIGLWTLADRRGRLEDRPKRIKAELFPYDNVDVEKLLTHLSDAGFIVRYKGHAYRSVENMPPRAAHTEVGIIQIVNFEKHQRITGSEAESESRFAGPDEQIPDFSQDLETQEDIEGNTLETPRNQQGITLDDRKGKEGKGINKGTEKAEENGSAEPSPLKALSKIGEFQNVEITEEELQKLQERFPEPGKVETMIESLSTYLAQTGKRYRSHYATMLNWARKEIQRVENPQGSRVTPLRPKRIMVCPVCGEERGENTRSYCQKEACGYATYVPREVQHVS